MEGDRTIVQKDPPRQYYTLTRSSLISCWPVQDGKCKSILKTFRGCGGWAELTWQPCIQVPKHEAPQGVSNRLGIHHAPAWPHAPQRQALTCILAGRRL